MSPSTPTSTLTATSRTYTQGSIFPTIALCGTFDLRSQMRWLFRSPAHRCSRSPTMQMYYTSDCRLLTLMPYTEYSEHHRQNCDSNSNERPAHMTSILKLVHWFPNRQLLANTVAAFVCKTRRNGEPDYLFSLHEDYTPRRQLRSSNIHSLCVSRTKLMSGECAFRIAALQRSLLRHFVNC